MKKEITISKFVATINGNHSEEFDSREQAIDQVKEWFKIDFDNEEGWSDTTREELRRYVEPVVNGRTLSWEEFDALEEVNNFELKFDRDFDGYEVDGVRTYIEDESETYYVEVESKKDDGYEVEGTWSVYLDAEYRTYFDLDNICVCDIESFIKKTLADSQVYVKTIYAFDMAGNSLDVGTARGKFIAYKL